MKNETNLSSNWKDNCVSCDCVSKKLYNSVLEQNERLKEKLKFIVTDNQDLQKQLENQAKMICEEIKKKIHADCISYMPAYADNDEVIEYVDITYGTMIKIIARIQSKFEKLNKEKNNDKSRIY